MGSGPAVHSEDGGQVQLSMVKMANEYLLLLAAVPGRTPRASLLCCSDGLGGHCSVVALLVQALGNVDLHAVKQFLSSSWPGVSVTRLLWLLWCEQLLSGAASVSLP